MSSTERLGWLDNAKAIGMCLVVYGHCGATPQAIERWIYSFHMPLFFVLAGFLLKERDLALPYKQFLARTLRALGPAYLVFAAVGYAAWLVVLRHVGNDSHENVPPWKPLLAIAYGSGTPRQLCLQPAVLWFFPCLAASRLLTFGLYRLRCGYALIGSSFLSLVGMALPKGIALPFELDSALVAQGFLVLGVEARRYGIMERSARPSPVAIVLLLAGGAVLALANGPVDMRSSQFGSAWLFYGSSVASCLGLLAMCRYVRYIPFAASIASNTIVIFPLHVLVFSVFAATYVFVLHLPLSIRNNVYVGLAASAVNLTVLTLASPIVRRFLPWLYGLKVRNVPV